MSSNRDGPTQPAWNQGDGGMVKPENEADESKNPNSGPTDHRDNDRITGDSNPKTRLVQSRRSSGVDAELDPMRDPVVGWLIVVAGVGKGTHRALGYGQNVVGRGADTRIKLIYGHSVVILEGAETKITGEIGVNHYDGTVSSKHFIINYDERTRKFYIVNSPDSTNNTYIKGDDAPLMAPRELKAFDRIQAGKTELLFVPLCHEDDETRPGFDWKDT